MIFLIPSTGVKHSIPLLHAADDINASNIGDIHHDAILSIERTGL